MRKLDPHRLKANIEAAAEYDFGNSKVFGCAYRVCQGGRIVYDNCFGSVVPTGNTPVTQDTLFRMASMTKPVTALAALILIDRGLLSLSDPVSKYLPGFANVHVAPLENGGFIDKGSVRNQLTIRHLLTHTNGIGCEPEKYLQMTDADKATLDASIRFYLRNGLDFEPDSMQQYSGCGAFDVMARIIELIDGRDYETYLKEEIFMPCGMNDTVFIPTKDQWARMIAMHNKSDDRCAIGETFENCVFYDYPCTHFLGGAGLVSTLRDYSAFAELLRRKSRINEKYLVSPEIFSLMHIPHVSESIMPGHERWGLGVRVIVDDAYPYLPVNTFGWSGAFGTHFWVDPENDVTAVYMKNTHFDGGAANESARNFEKAVYTAFAE